MFEDAKRKYYEVGAATGAALGTLAVAAPVALAEGESTSAVDTAITGMASTVATQGQTTVANILPVLAPLIATILVAALGVRLVKKFGK